MLVLLGSYLLLVFVLPVALSALVGYRSLPVGRRCPRCGTDTLRLVSRLAAGATLLLRRTRVERRWCLDCGWEGTTRLARDRRRSLRAAPEPRPGPPVAKETIRSTQTLDVRSIDIDGAPWRVMLQCWGKTGLFYGRLIFVAPSGRLWLDAVESFSGTNEHEVLGQALALPDRLLTNRLRRLVSD